MKKKVWKYTILMFGLVPALAFMAFFICFFIGNLVNPNHSYIIFERNRFISLIELLFVSFSFVAVASTIHVLRNLIKRNFYGNKVI